MISLFKREGIPLNRLPDDVNPNEDHLAQASWNIFCIMHHELIHPELNDIQQSVDASERLSDVSTK
jgi:hypothetical protein